MKYLNFDNIILQHGKTKTESRSKCDISTKLGNTVFANPVIMANMPSICNSVVCNALDHNRMLHIYPRNGGTADVINHYIYMMESGFRTTSISIGIKYEWLEMFKTLRHSKASLDFITIDCALSYSNQVERVIKTCQDLFPDTFLIVGNGCSVEWLEWLAKLKVGAAKVGIGVSPSCRTREHTGFGSSTATDLFLLSERVEGRVHKIKSDMLVGKSVFVRTEMSEPLDIKLIADGGFKKIGDIAKAIRLGADMIMTGSLFADCSDLPSSKDGYYGNSTAKAKGYSENEEGANVQPFKVTEEPQTLQERIKTISERLASSVSYAGGSTLTLKDLQNVDIKIL